MIQLHATGRPRRVCDRHVSMKLPHSTWGQLSLTHDGTVEPSALPKPVGVLAPLYELSTRLSLGPEAIISNVNDQNHS